jgi:hypothetical protein
MKFKSSNLWLIRCWHVLPRYVGSYYTLLSKWVYLSMQVGWT